MSESGCAARGNEWLRKNVKAGGREKYEDVSLKRVRVLHGLVLSDKYVVPGGHVHGHVEN